ncbi:MAG TPA: hypothetical protein DCZ10_15735 [Pelotomaculum sp.]|nr:hypothetical protein [Pelotomaculum sp.]
MALSPVLPYRLEDVQQLVYAKTNIGGYFFDAFLRMEHTSSITLTEHPIQSGGTAVDHSYLNPSVLIMEIGMSDTAKSLVDGQFAGGWSRSVRAYEILLELQKQRLPIQVVTRLKVYDNMLIETIAAPDDYTTLYGLRATVTLREIFVATVKTVKISSRPHATDSTPRGDVQPVETKEAIILEMIDLYKKLFL